MEPLKPEQRRTILAARPQAAPADIDEYEQLLAQRFYTDPSVIPPVMAAPLESGARLAELRQKLFGD